MKTKAKKKKKVAKTGFAKQVKQQLRSWSPSNLGLYEACPAKAKYKLLDKLPDTGGKGPMDRGIEIHNAAANYITQRKKDPLHADLKAPKIKKLIEELKKEYKARKARVELDLAFTKEWKVTEWFGDSAWLRLKVDVLRLTTAGKGRVIDWKTGKLRMEKVEEYDDQLGVYAVAALTSGLIAKEVTSALAFTDAGKILERPAGTLKRADLKEAQDKWTLRVKPMLSDTTFAPRPGNACQWCPYSCNKGGPCEF